MPFDDGPDLPAKARLLWLARRGMLELDTWFNRFLEQHYDELPIAQKRRFVYLLEQDDMTLFGWFAGNVDPPPEFQELVDVIRTRQ